VSNDDDEAVIFASATIIFCSCSFLCNNGLKSKQLLYCLCCHATNGFVKTCLLCPFVRLSVSLTPICLPVFIFIFCFCYVLFSAVVISKYTAFA